MISYYDNEFGEPLEEIGDIICNLDFWDCECQESYIHHFTVAKCLRCNAEYKDMPAAREIEVENQRIKS
jgi:hypothetical protein